jgi:hypothetical protein
MPLVWYSNNKEAVAAVAKTRPGIPAPLGWGWSVNNDQAVAAVAAQYPGRTPEMYAAITHPTLDGGTYSSFAGSDITASITVPGLSGPITFAELRTISYSTKREARPARILGTLNPIGWAMGPRMIAGTLVFTSFDRYVWYRLYGDYGDAMEGATPGSLIPADMLPAFDITVTALNEYGQAAHLCIRGVRVVDEGMVVGVDDMYIEQTHTFVAQDVVPWIPTDVSRTET